MAIIHLATNGQRLVRVDCPKIASGDKNLNHLHIDFCPSWDGFVKTATFYRNANDVYHAALDNDDTCLIPWEVLQTNGILYLGVFGVNGDVVKTSQVIAYRIAKGAITDNTKPSDPTPDIYQQLLARVEEINKTTVKTVNGVAPDQKGNVEIAVGSDTPGGSGTPGATFTPSVSENGDLSWSNDKGLENPATVNIMGPPGDPGDSVYVKSVSESNEDGGNNVVTFSDGKTLNVRNGGKGGPGGPGVGIQSVVQTVTSSEDGGNNVITVTKTDGTADTFTVKNGNKGDRGLSVLRVTTAPSSYTTDTGGFTPKYRIALSTVLSQSGATEVRVGDTILRNYYTYPVGYVDSSYVYTGAYTSIRGNAGTSVTVSDVSESAVDGGTNTVTFSDGKTLNVRNGRTGSPGDPGYTPVRGVDYWTPTDVTAMESDISEKVAAAVASKAQMKPEFVNSIEECTDTDKLYVLPDGYIYAYVLTEKEVTTGPSCTNLLPLAVQSDGKTPYVGDNGEKGYRADYRVSSSGVEKSATGYYATGFIPVNTGDTVRVKGLSGSDGSGYCVAYYGNSTTTPWTISAANNPTNGLLSLPADVNNVRTFSPTATNTKYMRLTLKGNPDDFIITVNEEIVEGGGTEIITEYAWVNTGLAFVPADYEDRIVDLETLTAKHTAEINDLKQGLTGVTDITKWDAPIYDANIPVFLLSAEKPAMTNAAMTPADIYSKYDALMSEYPQYITKTDLGVCSDGVNHVYRYDFREPDSRHTSGYQWSETKTKAIIVSGIHYEWSGIYGLYYALEEITKNPALYNFRRNTHLIVIPCMNPYATIAANYQSGLSTPNSYGVRNANGVEIHRNFEVGWILTESGSTHYGGAEPLSEVETQYIDAIMRENTDAALFLTCHNFADENFNFIWPSVATPYMCNMGYRLIDKLSSAWLNKYGDELVGLEEYRPADIPSWDNRLGFAHISQTPGTETRQGTKYGIQSANVEINGRFWTHGTKANPEPSLSSFTMSRGAETYVNFLLTVVGCYDYKDKALYSPSK